MARRLEKGHLIVIEGIDGAGKTTQCVRLVEHLQACGLDAKRLREPTDGPFGRRIRQQATTGRVSALEELDLFIQDRRENVEKNIRPALNAGTVIVMDRYYYSTIAYQGARGLDPADIRRQNELFAPPADLLLYLRIPAELAKSRIEGERGTERDLFEKEDYLRLVQEQFDAMTDPQLLRIDGTLPPDAVFKQITEEVQMFLGV